MRRILMRIYQTAFQKELADLPTKLEVDTLAYRRGLISSQKDCAAYRRSVAGHEGEQTVLHYLKKYGKNHWIVIPNLWMNYFGNFECDLALLTKHKCYPLEVKNYFGDFVFKDGISTLNEQQLSVNPIFQARKSYSNIKEILMKGNFSVPVEGALIFVGIDNYVDIQNEIEDLKIIIRSHLLRYIKQIIKEENAYNGKSINWNHIIPHFGEYERASNFGPHAYSKKLVRKAKKGIFCAKCQNGHVQVKKFEIHCHCGHKENREKAVVRTIIEYCKLTLTSVFSSVEIYDFLGGQASKTYLVNILNKYFQPINNNRYTKYKVKNSVF